MSWRKPGMKCHFAKTGSISDFFVGDRVHGCERSSRLGAILVDKRIGFGAAILLSWLSVNRALESGGGVFSRGTPETS